MTAPEVFEYEVWLATHDDLRIGNVAADVRKYLVAASSEGEGYRIALDVAWRDDRQVTKVWWVP